MATGGAALKLAGRLACVRAGLPGRVAIECVDNWGARGHVTVRERGPDGRGRVPLDADDVRPGARGGEKLSGGREMESGAFS